MRAPLTNLVTERLLATSAIRRIRLAAEIVRTQRERSGIPDAIESQEGNRPVKG